MSGSVEYYAAADSFLVHCSPDSTGYFILFLNHRTRVSTITVELEESDVQIKELQAGSVRLAGLSSSFELESINADEVTAVIVGSSFSLAECAGGVTLNSDDSDLRITDVTGKTTVIGSGGRFQAEAIRESFDFDLKEVETRLVLTDPLFAHPGLLSTYGGSLEMWLQPKGSLLSITRNGGEFSFAHDRNFFEVSEDKKKGVLTIRTASGAALVDLIAFGTDISVQAVE